MSEIQCENERYQYYFEYNGETFTKNTEVKLTEDYLKTHTKETPSGERPIWPYQRFNNRVFLNGVLYYNFYNCKYDTFRKCVKYANGCLIRADEIDDAIEEIIKPYPIQIRKMLKHKDWEVPDVMIGWVVYIVALFFSMIFKDFGALWFFLSVLFFKWRHDMLWY